MLPDVATDIANRLAAAGLGLTLGANLFVADEIPEHSAPAVYCVASGGPSPEPYLGTGRNFRRLHARVVVRGEREKKPEGAQLARGIADALHLAQVAGYVAVYLRDSQPVFLGNDDHDAPGWSIGVECHHVS